ncbi:hypothetical protein [Cryptosporangium aurantiacum]|uniref:hypothetical protein n=1 Tax=Cryptosporangium aurantiacum TaxID=134849 RepID=UPI0011612A4C|nr:hypothetical protein [Cryptosporangium aurantiacum]
MTHAVPRPRKPQARTSTSRHPVTPVRPSTAADRRALVNPDRVPLDRQPPLPKRTPGEALDDVHRNSIIQISRAQLADGNPPSSDRWFRANREPEA